MHSYVHGYTDREALRLADQAGTLSDLLHHDTVFPAKSSILEAGCGTGAQTVFLSRQNPDCLITSMDISGDSLKKARARMADEGITNVRFLEADLFDLPFADGLFDHAFVCFVLEHLSRPLDALAGIRRLIRPGGTITAIEGDHGSAFFFPRSEAAREAIACQMELQARSGGNAMIGRELYPLLNLAGFTDVRVSPRMVYVDSSRPGLVEGFTRNTFTAMIEGIRQRALTAGITGPEEFDRGVRDLHRTTESDGVFCYTFFKAVGRSV